MTVAWCKTVTVDTWPELLQIMKAATGRKETLPTQYCPSSTRGHCFLILDLERPDETISGVRHHSRLTVCDLAAQKPAGNLIHSEYGMITREDGTVEYQCTGPVSGNIDGALQNQAKRINSSLTEFAQFITMTALASQTRTNMAPGQVAPGSNSFFLCKFLKKTFMQSHTCMVFTVSPEETRARAHADTCKLAESAVLLRLLPRALAQYSGANELAEVR